MKNEQRQITVFEHAVLKLNDKIDDVTIDRELLNNLEAFYGETGIPYFSLLHKGVRFNEYVGVLQIGNTLIEVLPKADKRFEGNDESTKWRTFLVDMLFAVGVFDIEAPSSSNLALKHNSILDLYFELFINEVEYLIRTGLIKKYHKEEGNVKSLKGSLLFAKHIEQNITHQERFYTRYSTYDIEHPLHLILYKALRLISQINKNGSLHSRIKNLLLQFPTMKEIKVSEETFDAISYNRKTQPYKPAINIAKLLLMQFHPDLCKGSYNVLALMFDMNMLWEKFVYISLYKHRDIDVSVHPQVSKPFWKPSAGYRSTIIPDIVINKGKTNCAVLDTKWKNLTGNNPSPDDLKQMYIYHQYYGAKRVALVYPGVRYNRVYGSYLEQATGIETQNECSLIFLSPEQTIRKWQKRIYQDVKAWLDN